MVHVIVRPFQPSGGERRVREEEILRDGSGRIQVVETGVVRCVPPLMAREFLAMDRALRCSVVSDCLDGWGVARGILALRRLGRLPC
jgi:hypothetical protein